MEAGKVLMIGPYPPPEGGWSTAIREEREELEQRGIVCRVLNIGPNRRIPSDEYISVHGAGGFVLQLFRHAFSGYLFRLHMNGDSLKGMAIVLLAGCIGMAGLRRPCLSFHAGADQRFFPHRGNPLLGIAWRVVFNLPRAVICDSDEIRDLISAYRAGGRDVYGVSPFSVRRVTYTQVELREEIEDFLSGHRPILFSYFAYRPEYSLEMFLDALRRCLDRYPSLGLLGIDDRSHPDPDVESAFSAILERHGLHRAVLTTGEVSRDEFLTVMRRADLCVRTPLTDGVCSSVLEAIHLGVPVVAADNGSRPEGVVTYDASSLDDMVAKIEGALEERGRPVDSTGTPAGEIEDTIARLVDIVARTCRLKSIRRSGEGS